MDKDLNIHKEERKRRHGRSGGSQGAKTFRRGRALSFYEKLIVRRDTLKQQLESQQLQSIQQVIAGELKATEAIINEFVAAFELDEISSNEENNE